jgi:hypothetical protein
VIAAALAGRAIRSDGSAHAAQDAVTPPPSVEEMNRDLGDAV